MTTKRSKPARSLPKLSASASGLAEIDRWSRIRLWLACGWPIAFCLYFYSFTLPNNPEWNRAAFWLELPSQLSLLQLTTARWANLGQRLDLICNSTAIVGSGFALGFLILRLLKAVDVSSLEGWVFAGGLGLSGLSLVTLAFGLMGWLSRSLFIAVLAVSVATEFGVRIRTGRMRDAAIIQESKAGWPPIVWIGIAITVPFLIVTWLGSMSPSTDFDIRAYHFLGPKEWYQVGRISFLEHNVYTSFPFLTEMLVLVGMVLGEDWYWGAVAGKCALFAFAPLTALALFAAGRRWFNPTVGVIAAVFHLTTPWICRISIIGYAEGGLTFYLFATLLAVILVFERVRTGAPAGRVAALAGLLAGSAMACKYTGLVQVIAPLGLAVIAAPISFAGRAGWRQSWKLAAAFAVGTAVAVGPWLLKNLVETGNPVYPLAYSIFGGRDLTPELMAKWQRVHSPPEHDFHNIVRRAVDVIADSDWLSALLYAFAPLALLWKSQRRPAIAAWAFAIYLFFAWWAFTHRLDRFWVPMIPVVAMLAGIGAGWMISFSRGSRLIAWTLIGLSIWFNFGLLAGTETSYLCGYNAFLADRNQARGIAENQNLTLLNAEFKARPGKVLCVGDGDLFEAQFPIVYNTVFDESIFQKWFAAVAPAGATEAELPLKPAKEIRDKLHAEGITHVYVNWSWIRTYWKPGNYGYTAFVAPDRFRQLVEEGVLRPIIATGSMSAEGMSRAEIESLQSRLPLRRTAGDQPLLIANLVAKIDDEDRDAINKWASGLLVRIDGHETIISAQIFAVR